MNELVNHPDTLLRLQAGLPIPIDGFGQLRQLTLREIVAFGESTYTQLISALLIDISNFPEYKNKGYSSYDLLLALSYGDLAFRQTYILGLEMFFNEKANYFQHGSEAYFYLGEILGERQLTQESFELIKEMLLKSNNLQIKKEEEYVAGNERARKFMEKLRKKKETEPKVPEKINLSSIISGLAWKSNSVNILNIWDLTLFQLYDGYVRTDFVDQFNQIRNGIAAGVYDPKGINLSNLNWANIIK